MTTPSKSEIVERARQLWYEDRLRREGSEALEINPEIEELREEGFIMLAQHELMTSETRKHSEWLELERIKNELPLETESLIFNIEEAMRSGIFVSGTSGSGKTNLCFHLAERLMQHGIIVFVLDPSQA